MDGKASKNKYLRTISPLFLRSYMGGLAYVGGNGRRENRMVGFPP
jgi:hypothetical protein